jgi:hypothetical protein
MFLDLVEGDNVDHSRVDLQPNDGAVVLIRVGQERVSFVLEQLRLDGLKAAATAIVPAGTFVAMSVELGAFGLGSLQLLGIVERSRPSLAVRFEGNDLVVRERLTATVALLADKLAVTPPPVERTQVIAREPDQPVDVLELKATVTRLMFEKEELRRDLQDFRTEALAMMRLLRREIEARHGPAPAVAPPAPPPMSTLPSSLPAVSTHQLGPEVSAVVRAAFNDDLAETSASTTTTASAASAPTTTPAATPTSSAQTFASTTTTRRVRQPVLLGPQLIDEFLSEAEAAWSAVVESSPPTPVGQVVDATDPGMRFDLSDL